MENSKPQRRVRYKGKYPKKFEEKYKELEPEKYQDIINHVISKGNTPAGMHRSIMVDEILSFFDIQPNQIGLDATLGFGGHSKEILTKLNHTGHLHATDLDTIELPKTEKRLLDSGFTQNDFTLHNLNFKDFDLIGEQKYDFILADLGVSSMQIDDPMRGFTFKFDGPLDLRMNPNLGIPANFRLRNLSALEIEGMLVENADETYAKEIAQAIVKEFSQGKTIDTTKALQKVIASALDRLPKTIKEDAIKKASQRTFQALRIDVNNEFESLYEFLEKIPLYLNKGGKVAILSFHSGEDRLVKKSFKQFLNDGIYQEISGPLSPSGDEVFTNSRAKSAKLRCAIKS